MAGQEGPGRSLEMGTARVEAFSDGVMAVIITIMALELRAPRGATLAAMREQLPGLLVYVLSFVVIGIYWNNHHHLLRAADRISGSAMWANLFLLFWLSLIPVLTEWLRDEWRHPLPAACYGAAALAAGFAYSILARGPDPGQRPGLAGGGGPRVRPQGVRLPGAVRRRGRARVRAPLDRLCAVRGRVRHLVRPRPALHPRLSHGLAARSKATPVSRSDTAHRVAIAWRSRERPSRGRRTGGPQFTQRGV
jgi:hypothetical protein